MSTNSYSIAFFAYIGCRRIIYGIYIYIYIRYIKGIAKIFKFCFLRANNGHPINFRLNTPNFRTKTPNFRPKTAFFSTKSSKYSTKNEFHKKVPLGFPWGNMWPFWHPKMFIKILGMRPQAVDQRKSSNYINLQK